MRSNYLVCQVADHLQEAGHASRLFLDDPIERWQICHCFCLRYGAYVAHGSVSVKRATLHGYLQPCTGLLAATVCDALGGCSFLWNDS